MNRKGFTLLEVLVVITLLGIVVGAAFANFGVGLRGYKKGVSRGEMLQEVRGGLRFLGADIEKMLPIKTDGMSFTANSFSLISVPDSKEGGMERTTYSFGEGALKRESSPINKKTGAKPVEIIRGIKNAGFDYFMDGKWAEELNGEDKKGKLPDALRVRMRLELDGEDGEFMTSFMLPVSREIKAEKAEKKDWQNQ